MNKYNEHMNRAQYLRRVGNNGKARMHEEYAESNYGFGT